MASILHMELEEYENAIKLYSLVDDAYSYAMIGICYMNLENYYEAIKYYQKALDSDLIDDESKKRIYYDIGLAYFYIDEYEKAKELYEKLLTLGIDDFIINCNLSDTYLNLKEPNKALKYALRAIELNDKDSLSYENAALAYKQLNNKELFEKYSQKAKELQKDS
jgi:tetratricopeptide (TPR) repeat protein